MIPHYPHRILVNFSNFLLSCPEPYSFKFATEGLKPLKGKLERSFKTLVCQYISPFSNALRIILQLEKEAVVLKVAATIV